MHATLGQLMPHFRGLGGEGNRRTFEHLSRLIPLKVRALASGTPVFDWTVPDQWTFHDAYVKDAAGRRVIDARRLNLHVMSHSRAVHQTMSWDELAPHLHSRADVPDAVPYRHTFYEDDWGFCLSHDQRQRIEAAAHGPYEVCVDAKRQPGPAALEYAECILPGDRPEQVLFSAHACHPSLANDNLAGVIVQAYLAQQLARRSRRAWTYRFVFAPATIGALAWLSRTQGDLDDIVGGLVLANLGDRAALTYQRSRAGDTPMDHAAASVLSTKHLADFDPTGGDERQFNSPGFNLPVGALMRSRPGAYLEYHTSADNADLVQADQLADALDACLRICDAIEARSGSTAGARAGDGAAFSPESESRWQVNDLPCQANQGPRPVNLYPHGEPQLGRRGVLAAIHANSDPRSLHAAVQWTLNLADGNHDTTDIARRSGMSVDRIDQAVKLLSTFDLLDNNAPTTSRG